ncbi:MAG: hypothetical protein EPN82_07325 [Bacteroidetes bacterium]|nr:MAG: hypothetical protein EPN82_07325 [Bacteroidota bacterium]
MKIKKYLLLLLLSIIIISCNSTIPPTVDSYMSEYFPSSIGNWWKYDNWVLDSNGVRLNKISVDSVVVENSIFYEGKNAVVLVTYSRREDTTIKITNYLAIEGSKLFAYLNLKYSDGDSIPWVKSADLSEFEWLIVEKNIKRDTLSIKTEYYEKTSVSKGGIIDFNYQNQTLKTQEFITNYMQRITTITPKDTLKTDMESINQDLYCKGIGWVYSKYIMTKNLGYERQGYESLLIDYYVK